MVENIGAYAFDDSTFADSYTGNVSPVSITLKQSITYHTFADADYLFSFYGLTGDGKGGTKAADAGGVYTRTGNETTHLWAWSSE
jgi:hypothetical protein